MKSENLLVAIQGFPGAFHEIAARNFFPSKQLHFINCNTFDEITDLLTANKIDYGIMAIENTVAGSLIPNYVLLRESPVKIIGEEYLRVKQNLMALHGTDLTAIKEIHSHYMAIEQCREYLKTLNKVRLIESIDTALSAKEIADNKITDRAAIASDLAAELYNLEIIADDIETNKKNYTRFLILTNENTETEIITTNWKSSLCFCLPHEKGSLSHVLSILNFYNMNLTKIQSMPIIGKEFKYFFYVDIVFKDYERYTQSLTAITPLLQDLHILGEYEYNIKTLEKIHHFKNND